MTRGVDGGVPCLVSILRYFNVAYLNCLFSPMSHAVLNKSLCGMSLFFKPMSHVTRTHVNLFNLRNDCVTMLILLYFFVRFFSRFSSALHRWSSTEILSRPLGFLLEGGPQCLIFVSGSGGIRTHVPMITMQMLYHYVTLTPKVTGLSRQNMTGVASKCQFLFTICSLQSFASSS